MASISVIVPTLDGQLHIERLIDSVRDLGPIFVVDAASRDETRELVAAAGAQVYEHAREGYSAQKDWALDRLPIETEWVLFLDADEFAAAGPWPGDRGRREER